MTLLTEKEAAEKWCPMARVAVAGVSSNRFGKGSEGSVAETSTRCIGSRCMAWRQLHAGYFADYAVRGYCGAFGKVEP